jgi:hypothetical protein
MLHTAGSGACIRPGTAGLLLLEVSQCAWAALSYLHKTEGWLEEGRAAAAAAAVAVAAAVCNTKDAAATAAAATTRAG